MGVQTAWATVVCGGWPFRRWLVAIGGAAAVGVHSSGAMAEKRRVEKQGFWVFVSDFWLNLNAFAILSPLFHFPFPKFSVLISFFF